MRTLWQPKRVRNDFLRLMCCYALIVAPSLPTLTGCAPAPPPDNGDGVEPDNGTPDDGTPDDGTPDDGQTDGQNGGDDGGQDNGTDGDQPVGAAALAGWWVIRIEENGGEPVWANAQARVVVHELGNVTFNISADDGREPYLTIFAAPGGGLTGKWGETFEEAISLFDDNWTGSASQDNDRINGSVPSADGDQVMTFYRAAMPEDNLNGVWTRDADGATLISAYAPERGLLMSLLDEDGDWPDDGHFDGEVETHTPYFEGLHGFDEFEGLLFDGGRRAHLRMTDDSEGIGGMLFTRSSEQGELTGRWTAGDRRWRDRTPTRGTRIIVEHDDTLYVHEVWDGFDRLTRSFRAARDGDEYTDPTASGSGWSGRLTGDGNRIVGTWIGYEDWYNSMDRNAAPAEDELDGEWYSISLDWNHHTGSGDIIRAYGTATITQDGEKITVIDSYEGGNTYRLEATWVGDHFEGEWWNEETPDSRSWWHGDYQSDGLYIHGTWVNGEWSFSAYPSMAPEEIPEDSNIILLTDPYDDRGLIFRDTELETVATFFRNQDTYSSIVAGTPDGDVEVTLDERMRPTRVVGMGESVTLVWADDASSFDVTIRRDSGETTSGTIPIDLSDAALLAMIDDVETDTGRDLSELADWINENPGYVLALARGEHSQYPFHSEAAKERRTQRRVSTEGGVAAFNFAAGAATLLAASGLAIQTAGTAGLITFASTALVKSAATWLIIAGGVAGAIGIAVLLGLVIVFVVVWLLEDYCCDPCNLTCLDCCPPPAPDD
jgi:hypothetical protein